jgi:glycosyltransferase involved in cell wall biosynthesis
LRILVVSNLFPPVVAGGYEVECEGVVRRLRERHEVLVLSSVEGRERAGEDRGVLRALPFLRYSKADSLRAPLTALRGARVARGVLRGFRPEVIFVWNGAQLPHSALWVLNTAGVPLAYRVCEYWFSYLYAYDIFMRHLVPGERGLRGLWARGMRLVNRHPALRLDPARRAPARLSWCSSFLRGACPVPPGIEPVAEEVVLASTDHTASFDGLERAPDPGDPLLAFVGRLEEHKGPQVAVAALGLLAERHGLRPRLALVGAGEPEERAALAAQARAIGVEGQVELTGPLRGPALRALLGRAHAWLVPAVWEEPMGLTALEAALARVPAVVARSGGLTELLVDGEQALYFDRGDAVGCAEAVAATLGDPAAAEARAERAHARAREVVGEPYLAAMERFVEAARSPG